MGRNETESRGRVVNAVLEHVVAYQLQNTAPGLVHGLMGNAMTVPVAPPDELITFGDHISKFIVAGENLKGAFKYWRSVLPSFVPQGAQNSPYSDGDFIPTRTNEAWFEGADESERLEQSLQAQAEELAKLWELQTDTEVDQWRQWVLQLSQMPAPDHVLTHTPTTEPESRVAPDGSAAEATSSEPSQPSAQTQNPSDPSQTFSAMYDSHLASVHGRATSVRDKSATPSQPDRPTTIQKPTILVPASQSSAYTGTQDDTTGTTNPYPGNQEAAKQRARGANSQAASQAEQLTQATNEVDEEMSAVSGTHFEREQLSPFAGSESEEEAEVARGPTGRRYEPLDDPNSARRGAKMTPAQRPDVVEALKPQTPQPDRIDRRTRIFTERKV
jgi:hypothetical protein